MIHGGQCNRQVNIDFSVNLNPINTPKIVVQAIEEGVKKSNEYPDYDQSILRGRLASLEGIDVSNVYAGNGASDLIMAVVRAINPCKAIIIEPGFSGYRHALCSHDQCEIEQYEYLDMCGFKEDITRDADILFIANPMNPIGNNIDECTLESIVSNARDNNCAVVLDESFLLLSDGYKYVDSTSRALMVNKYTNLYIIRSFTKLMAIPGIRIGYVMSCEENIDSIRRQLSEWNVSTIADYAARACVESIKGTEFVADSIEYIKQEREYLVNELTNRGYKVYKSDTVFVTFYSDNDYQDLYNELLERGIHIRDCSNFYGLKKGCFRIAIKKHIYNIKLIEAIDDIRACQTRRN